ncbi:hypothetical protein UFOVP244_22 [uncultured Caudovirales phage]|uniref:Uncharacterized protein n=1 Tax=uncultured Caudovirales phage TaxID=2100421 RepID=A0A6J7WRW2_9CAUD|nr:hypothetical protein UFOVP244_22 [uncultured Caudovirales phage]
MKDMSANPNGQDYSTEAAKETKEVATKKIVSALLTTLEHQLGREPTTDELAEALQQKQEIEEAAGSEEDDGLPNILKYKIYYGLKSNPDGAKEPDPESPIYYENHDGSSWFDVDNGMWSSEKPRSLDHFYSRCLGDSENQKDVFDAIVYGVMGDDDYHKLSQTTGMLDPRCVRAYELHKRAKEQYETIQSMEKSIEEMVAPASEPGANLMQEIMQSAGLNSEVPAMEMQEAPHEPRQLLLESPFGVDPRLRRYIQAEIASSMDVIVARVLEALEPQENPQAADHTWDISYPTDGLEKSDNPEEDHPALSSPEALKAAHGRKVFVYFNLHKKLWSVKDHQTGKVIAHAKKVSVDNPTFKVSEAGRQRVLQEKKKNVHAGVFGSLNAAHDDFSGQGRSRVSYNPYKAGHFYESGTDNPVHTAEHATLHVEEKPGQDGKPARIPHVFAKNAAKKAAF